MTRSKKILKRLRKLILDTYQKEGVGGLGFVSHYPSYSGGDLEKYQRDDPRLVSGDYKTYRPFGLPKGTRYGNLLPFRQELAEQEDEEMEQLPPDEDVTEEPLEQNPPEGEPAAPGEDMSTMGGMGAMGDPTSMGMPGEEPPKTPGELGRIYELKKIYTRLTAIETYLAHESDPFLLNVRDLVSKAVELFEIISSNFESYKNKLDEIIITYYTFVQEVYELVRDHYKKISKES